MPNADTNDCNNKPNRWAMKNNLGIVCKRMKELVIKTPSYNLKTDDGKENYSQSLLLLFMPWRKEEELTGDNKTFSQAVEFYKSVYPEILEYDERKQRLLLPDEILDKAGENKSEDKNYVNKKEDHDILDAEVLSEKVEEVAIPDHIVVHEAELIKKISKLNYD
uniref:Uncharacterized protein n=1 Tax=Romanomermis culicivorax TaxID=13658 RepID=A0A915HKL6_ROMCU